MINEKAKQKIRGPFVPIITFFRDDLSIDMHATQAHAQYLIDHGFGEGRGCVLAAGSGGDFPMLSIDERKDVATAVAEVCRGKLPFMVGAQDTNVRNSIAMARHAETLGAEAVQLAPTYFYPASADDAWSIFHEVHEATESMNIAVYNSSSHNHNLTIDVVNRITELERIVAVKWSGGGNLRRYLDGILAFRERLVIIDNQGLEIQCRMMGGNGFVTHLATIWPEQDLVVWDHLEAHRYAEAQAAVERANWPFVAFRSKMFQRTGGESNVLKAALELCGRQGGPSRPPMRSLTEEERMELHRVMTDIGVPDVRQS